MCRWGYRTTLWCTHPNIALIIPLYNSVNPFNVSMGEQASPLSRNSNILSCRKKTSTRHWKTQFTRSINHYSYATQHKHTPGNSDDRPDFLWTINRCNAIQRRRIFRIFYKFYKCLKYNDFSLIIRLSRLIRQSDIRRTWCWVGDCQLNGTCPNLGGLLTCTLACSWMSSDPNTFCLGKQCKEGKGRTWNKLQGWGGGRWQQLTGQAKGMDKARQSFWTRGKRTCILLSV